MKINKFSNLIRDLRIQNKLTLRQVAAKIDLDQSTLSKIERGEMIAPTRIIRPLADVLNFEYKTLQIRFLSEKLFLELEDMDYCIPSLEKVLEKIKSGVEQQANGKEKMILLKKIKKYFKPKPVEKAWIFGSFARDEETVNSDLDILVQFSPSADIDLFDYIGMSQDLEDITGLNIDLVEEGHLIDDAQNNVEEEKILIYER